MTKSKPEGESGVWVALGDKGTIVLGLSIDDAKELSKVASLPFNITSQLESVLAEYKKREKELKADAKPVKFNTGE